MTSNKNQPTTKSSHDSNCRNFRKPQKKNMTGVFACENLMVSAGTLTLKSGCFLMESQPSTIDFWYFWFQIETFLVEYSSPLILNRMNQTVCFFLPEMG